MESSEVINSLKLIFDKHGVNCTVEDDWVIPYGRLPAIRAFWYPSEQNGRLDIQVLVENDVLIEECFAGIGAGSQGYYDALQNFMVNSLHVFLAAFWDLNDSEQVVTERWQVLDESYSVYIGNFGTRSSEQVNFSIPNGLLAEIENTLKKESLHENTHWIRIFFCNVSGEQIFEALLDNKNWESGVSCLKQISWEKNEGYYSIRNFILLRKLSNGKLI